MYLLGTLPICMTLYKNAAIFCTKMYRIRIYLPIIFLSCFSFAIPFAHSVERHCWFVAIKHLTTCAAEMILLMINERFGNFISIKRRSSTGFNDFTPTTLVV